MKISDLKAGDIFYFVEGDGEDMGAFIFVEYCGFHTFNPYKKLYTVYSCLGKHTGRVSDVPVRKI